MAESKKIIVSLPNSLLDEVDNIAAAQNMNRSQFIREAMKVYVEERKRREVRERMKAGYLAMASLNAAYSEEWLTAEEEALQLCENYL